MSSSGRGGQRRRKLGRGTTNLWAEWGWQTQLWWWGHLCNDTLGHGSATGICPSSCPGQKLEGLPSTGPWVVAAVHIAPGRPQAQWHSPVSRASGSQPTGFTSSGAGTGSGSAASSTLRGKWAGEMSSPLPAPAPYLAPGILPLRCKSWR